MVAAVVGETVEVAAVAAATVEVAAVVAATVEVAAVAAATVEVAAVVAATVKVAAVVAATVEVAAVVAATVSGLSSGGEDGRQGSLCQRLLHPSSQVITELVSGGDITLISPTAGLHGLSPPDGFYLTLIIS
ncbi:hypothetical protein ElyMa_005944600 [Elysia marginata]|uniref:Uncharacterized protein n=1 Tax=Elysia marginata TaxID=1093978 RepID=A0AAV4G9U6_9GAST|nr:hypothetical protein ElyMa_005944600 [Elysia marginata]